MDQTVLSGVGNVYRAEVLFRNRINPHRPGNKLQSPQLAGDLDRSRRTDAARRGVQPNRRTYAPSTRPRRWAVRHGKMIMAVRSMSTGVLVWPAWSAAPKVRTGGARRSQPVLVRALPARMRDNSMVRVVL